MIRLENRQEYRRVFDYQPEYLVGGADGGIGFNLDMLFNAKKNPADAGPAATPAGRRKG